VVCVSPKEVSFRLVRRGYRLARRTEGELVCLYVKSSDRASNDKHEALLGEVFALARNLGGQVVELEGDSVGEQIIKYINANKTTMVVMGQSAPSRWEEIVRGSLVTRLMRETRDIDIVVVADTGPE
jgi:two-component system sensor histidine kinase KdpD